MKNPRLALTVALAFVFFVAYVAPVSAVDYNPGVSQGQWVKYGDTVAIGRGLEVMNKTDWFQVEVTSVSGKNVTLHMTGEYKNGTDINPLESSVNVETGRWNKSVEIGYSILIAANLQQGDNITKPATPSSYVFKINSTQTRTYMGGSRTCNVLNFTASYPIVEKVLMIWDKASGVLMEADTEYASGISGSVKTSFKAIDTNIFLTGAAGVLMSSLIYAVAAVVIIVVVIGGVAIVMRRRKPPKPTTETKTTARAK
jgi:hypothetical protein